MTENISPKEQALIAARAIDDKKGSDIVIQEDGKWILLDYGQIVVHIFLPEQREYYRLEQLWDEAPTVDVAAAGIEDPVYSERIAALIGRNAQAESDGEEA